MAPLVIIIVLLVLGLIVMAKGRGAERLSKEFSDLKLLEPKFIQAHRSALQLFNSRQYLNNKKYQQWKSDNQSLLSGLSLPIERVKTEDQFKKILIELKQFYNHGREIIDKHNQKIVLQEIERVKPVLDRRGIRYNDHQLAAIVSEEDNTLVVAGAGTGKTTTILGKVAYLLDCLSVKPEEILLLSFLGKAVEELEGRLGDKFPNVKLEARTFHSFGLSVIGEIQGKRPDVAFTNTSRRKFLNDCFETLLKDSNYLHLIVEYFSYYLKPVELNPSFKNLDEYFKFLKGGEYITLQKEQVKSQQEVMIANFLYRNGVRYVYEEPYKHKTADREHRQYKPDFHLSDYDIYLEHFGIGRDGMVRFVRDEAKNRLESEKYRQGMEIKREWHKLYETKLIETYSYEFTEGNWQELLTEKLRVHNVKFSRRDLSEVLKVIRESGYIREIAELFDTFLDLTKSNGYTLPKLGEVIRARGNHREVAFFKIFTPIYQAHEEYLKKIELIDFHDMLIKATEFIRTGRYQANFKYVIIDEFQDFSVSKHHLVKALCDQNPETKLFCVGDDWQSIFRFAGSDISLMTQFEKMYGFTKRNELVTTNRFNSEIARISNEFILKNPHQIRKEVQSGRPAEITALKVYYSDANSSNDQILEQILGSLSDLAKSESGKKSVFLLGRYKYNEPENLSGYKKKFDRLSIEFRTVHASKGSEADYVIVLSVISDVYGFPSQATDDPILDIVLSKPDPYPHSEERRLMYVALTRAREAVSITTEKSRTSPFVFELEAKVKFNAGDDAKAGIKCSNCGGIMILRQSEYGFFYGCSNFPNCEEKLKVRI